MQKGQVGAMWKSILSTEILTELNIYPEGSQGSGKAFKDFYWALASHSNRESTKIIQGEFVKWTFPEIQLSQVFSHLKTLPQVFLNAQLHVEGIRAEQSATGI